MWHEVIDRESGWVKNRILVCAACWPAHAERTRPMASTWKVEVKEVRAETVSSDLECYYCAAPGEGESHDDD